MFEIHDKKKKVFIKFDIERVLNMMVWDLFAGKENGVCDGWLVVTC